MLFDGCICIPILIVHIRTFELSQGFKRVDDARGMLLNLVAILVLCYVFIFIYSKKPDRFRPRVCLVSSTIGFFVLLTSGTKISRSYRIPRNPTQ